jgi:hypothetical protein
MGMSRLRENSGEDVPQRLLNCLRGKPMAPVLGEGTRGAVPSVFGSPMRQTLVG